jgi:hypothetical protein
MTVGGADDKKEEEKTRRFEMTGNCGNSPKKGSNTEDSEQLTTKLVAKQTDDHVTNKRIR